jgi:protein-S-isoprenylcysteine O-methyltransferase Ste14
MRLWRPTPAREWLAAAVVAAGLAVTVWARAALGRNWDGCVAFKQGHVLVVSGPYRYVRHPIYSGLFVMALGTAMLGAWSWGFALAALLLVSFWFKLRAEERLLTEHFPDAYPAYRRRVKALIPYVF